jgi:two-component system, chemotaxis family, chemotaxis protein CheY
MKTLIVEDDFTSRLFLQTILSRYGECHIAVNGKEAVEACRSAGEGGQRYDLICMDIMMPEMDGLTAMRAIREQEAAAGIFTKGAKIIMTTALGDIKDVSAAFQELCDSYIMKPINARKLLQDLKGFGLIQ